MIRWRQELKDNSKFFRTQCVIWRINILQAPLALVIKQLLPDSGYRKIPFVFASWKSAYDISTLTRYWDWARNARVPDIISTIQQVVVEKPQGFVRINNPLYSYIFNPFNPGFFPYPPVCSDTNFLKINMEPLHTNSRAVQFLDTYSAPAGRQWKLPTRWVQSPAPGQSDIVRNFPVFNSIRSELNYQ